MRGKWLKIAAVIAGVVVVLVISLLILAKVLITPERVRAAMLPVAEDFLHRPVDLERIEVGLFSGISCTGLSIGEREGEDLFVKAETLVLRYRLWPLLFGRVVVDEATLNRPFVRIARNADGSYSFDDLLASDKDASAAPARSERKQGSSIDLLVTRLSVGDGRVEFSDHEVRPDRTVVTRLDELNIAAQDLSPDGPFPVSFDFRLNDAPVSWDGTVDPGRKRIAGQFQVSGFSAGPLEPYLAEAFPGQMRSLVLGADLQVEIEPQSMSSRGKIRFEKIGLTLDALPEAPIEDARLLLDHDVTVETSQGKVTIRSLRADFNHIAVEAQGEISDYSVSPRLDLQMRLPQLSVSDLVAALPGGVTGGVADPAPSGRIEGEMHLAGATSVLETLIESGSLTMTEAGVSFGQLQPRLTGTVRLGGDALSARGMQLEMAGNRFDIDLKADKLFAETKYVATDVKSGEVDFAAFLPQEKSDSAGPEATSGKKEDEVGPVRLPLKMDGKVRIAKARYQGLALEDVFIDWSLAENVVRLEQATAAVASGGFDGKAVVDLGRKGLAYDANVQLKDVDAAEIVTALAPRAGGTVFGRVDLSMNLRGSGTKSSVLKRNLAGGGRFAIRQGELTGAGVMQSLSAFLDLDDLRVFRFDAGEGTFNIRDGAVFLDASFTGSKARLLPAGRIGLDQSLDLLVKTYLSPENTRKVAGRGTFGEVIADDQGWGLLPLMLTGTLTDPAVSLDRQALAEQVKKGTKRKLREKLQEKILEEMGEPKEEGEEGDPAKKLLEDTLRGLFGN